MIGHLPTGTKGFDANVVIHGHTAKAFAAHGYRFAVRYVPRVTRHANDITATELATLRRNGLAVMLVQHVALPGWKPDGPLGAKYGETAAREAMAAGYAKGAVLWCDLEEVHRWTPPSSVIAYCNAWHDVVRAGGYAPGLYVGYGSGLTAHELYYRLKFRRYWSSYNLNADEVPVVRGVQMRQHAAGAADRVPGASFEIDVDLIGQDAMGDSPLVMLARGDR